MTTVSSSPLLQPTFRSRSSTNTNGRTDVTSLTSFNPFAEEDEHDQSSFNFTSLFEKVRNVVTSGVQNTTSSSSPLEASSTSKDATSQDTRPTPHSQSSLTTTAVASVAPSAQKASKKANRPTMSQVSAAPPLVSLTPAQPEVSTYIDSPTFERSSSRMSNYTGGYMEDGYGTVGNVIPGFPMPREDDTRSIKTSTSLHRANSNSVSKAIRKIRGEGLSRDYWMDDENCKECYDCKSVFTTWRRKHHCRICGQIFCARCASSIIKGSRFGHDGMIRACNLCLSKLSKADSDDEDDRMSTTSSFPGHFSFPSLFGNPSSPFSSTLRTQDPGGLYSINESRSRVGSFHEDFAYGSRPMTPTWEGSLAEPAPFRRTLSTEEEAKDSLGPLEDSDPFAPELSPIHPSMAANGQNNIDFPLTIPVDQTGNGPDALNSIAFPMGSPEKQLGSGEDTPHPGMIRSRFNSYDVPTPFIRSRVQSRLDIDMGPLAGEIGWRTRRESTAYAQELNLMSMLHLKLLLRQLLTNEHIPDIKTWEAVLLRLSLRIARDLTFASHSASSKHQEGDEMDVRRYVKIKKIPGGSPTDSEFVDGVVITKNVAHKRMSRVQRNPRIMLVTFPLEFSRVEGQYLHFGQIVRQEKEYLGNLASRIAALRPHVVLVEKSVSRLALDALAAHGISVARAVKPSAISFIARLTQADVFSSISNLSLSPRLGHCAKYSIRTFDHPLIPGQRKTYMRFEGCNFRDQGCTIVLRGSDEPTLRRVKKVMKFLIFVVRNLKLETCVWKDELISLPSFFGEELGMMAAGGVAAFPSPSTRYSGTSTLSVNTLLAAAPSLSSPHLPTPISDTRSKGVTFPTSLLPSQSIKEASDDEDLPNEDLHQLRLSRRINEALEPYRSTFISVSATLRFLPPYPLRRMKELDDQLLEAKRGWEDEIVRREEMVQASHIKDETITQSNATTPGPFTDVPRIDITTPPTTFRDDIVSQIEALPTMPDPGSPPLTTSPLSGLGQEGSSYFTQAPAAPGVVGPGSILPPNISTPLATVHAVTESQPLKTIDDISAESRFTYLRYKHREALRIWEWYLRKNKDDFVVDKYQCISMLEYTIPVTEFGLQRACFAPALTYMTFYGENDCTLGHFVEQMVKRTVQQFLDPKAVCTGKGCEQPLSRHCKVYVHNGTRLVIAAEQWDGQIKNQSLYYPHPDTIMTWSTCRVCGSVTPFIPVSMEMQKYSFAKFIELLFYPTDVKLVQGAGCQHNIYEFHTRYFALKGLTVRFQTDSVTLYEPVYPPSRIRVRPETQLELKNKDFERLHQRNLIWYTALVDDLKLISIDASTGDEEHDLKLIGDINMLIERAVEERDSVARQIDQIYREYAGLHSMSGTTQLKLSNKRSSTFGSVRAMWPRRYELSGSFDLPHLPSSSVSEAEEGAQFSKMRRTTGDSFASLGDKKGNSPPSSDPSSVAETPSVEEISPPIESSQADLAEKIPEPVGKKSGSDSDSTIATVQGQEQPPESVPRISRLPRRSSQNPSVADLIKRYQDYLPPSGVSDLARTAMSPNPLVSESEAEYSSPVIRPVRHKSRRAPPKKVPASSDFESSYAANIAPRYLTHARRHGAHTPKTTRIPLPVPPIPPTKSQQSSRRPSPEKKTTKSKQSALRFSRPSSPHLDRPEVSTPSSKPGRSKLGKSKDKLPPRLPTSLASKSTFRRPPSSSSGKVSSMTRHFEKLGKEARRTDSRYAVIRGKRARPVASSKAKVEVLDSLKDAIEDESDDASSSSEADDEGDGNDDIPSAPLDTVTNPPSPAVVPALAGPSETSTSVTDATSTMPAENQPENLSSSQVLTVPNRATPPSGISLPPSPSMAGFRPTLMTLPSPSELDLSTGNPERHSILKAISGLWLQSAPTLRQTMDVEDPLDDPEHIFRDASMVVRTDEPTSIIALALKYSSLSHLRAEKRTARTTESSGEAFMPDDHSVAESSSTWGVVDVDAVDHADPTEDLRSPSSKLPWAISFESGGLTISCTVLYPEQFDALRRTYDCERSMIESLARCVKWDASGGKSGSAFLKTKDDRFIAKELSRPELQTMETFAPAYFDYMLSAVCSDRPTLLAKVFGCYKITFRKTNATGAAKTKSTQMNLLVMENLFYDRRFSKIYDLKGSTRNRHVQSTGRANEVLLDENLVEAAHENPFYLREHSKRIIRGALYNDTKFLADINVMDYSLVCGVDSENDKIVVGIVDYIRTYTWDKRLESWVKESAFLGGAGKGEPTIVTPKQYRQRFVGAMERYFPLVILFLFLFYKLVTLTVIPILDSRPVDEAARYTRGGVE
ncbi:hypothetical protein DL96DRAFT_1575071 [Flagelloscypha sp. PMI_526]|nr:hypothetical protein DL96DRAFT_1575071 [Flagelloscypha sp. PMI_526]